MAATLTACAQPINTANKDKSMLNEIYLTRIPNVATQRADVNTIVLKYLPIGTSKIKTLELLNSLQEGKIEESMNQITYSTHKGEGYKGNRRDINIKIDFDREGNINSVISHIDKSNNL